MLNIETGEPQIQIQVWPFFLFFFLFGHLIPPCFGSSLTLSTTKRGTDLGTLVVPFDQTFHLSHIYYTSLLYRRMVWFFSVLWLKIWSSGFLFIRSSGFGLRTQLDCSDWKEKRENIKIKININMRTLKFYKFRYNASRICKKFISSLQICIPFQ